MAGEAHQALAVSVASERVCGCRRRDRRAVVLHTCLLLLLGVLDPVTLEPVVNPAISPAGHVMGLATWKAVLSETGRCPFTKAPLRPDMLTVLTANNIERHRARIISM
jgi:hypothetical protein